MIHQVFDKKAGDVLDVSEARERSLMSSDGCGCRCDGKFESRESVVEVFRGLNELPGIAQSIKGRSRRKRIADEFLWNRNPGQRARIEQVTRRT